MGNNKKSFTLPTAYTVLLVITIIISIVTQFLPGVKSAKLSDVVMAPINGLNDAIDICLYVLLIGGFLGVVTITGSLNAGIGAVVKNLNGKELLLIPALMFIFSLGGTSFGMAEETLAFMPLITTTMMISGFDPLVAVATVVLGAGCGVLGSTVNPFLVSISISALAGVGIQANEIVVMGIGVALWLTSLLISIFFVMRYAKKVKNNPSETLLSEVELNNAKETFLHNSEEVIEFTTKRKIVLSLFAFTFIVMVIGIIPWQNFGINIFNNTTFLTGASLGNWLFSDLSSWFLLMAIIIGLVYGLKEKEIASAFVSGAADMVGVALVIGIARGISVIMKSTGLDAYVLNLASSILSGMSPIVFTNVAYVIYMILAFFIPSTSGLSGLSIPIFGPLAAELGFAPEIIISILSAGSGIVNLITPTSGVIMGGLTITRVEYTTWIKFVWKILIFIFIASAIILSASMLIL